MTLYMTDHAPATPRRDDGCPRCDHYGTWPLPFRCPRCAAEMFPRSAHGTFAPRGHLRNHRPRGINTNAETNDARAFHTKHATTLEFRDDEAEGLAQLRRTPALKQPSEPRPWMDMLMRRELDRLILIADGGTTSFQAKISGSHEKHDPMSDRALAVVDKIAFKWDAAENHWRRLTLLSETQTFTRRLRFAPIHPGGLRGTAEWRERIARDPRACRVVADVYGVGRQTVSRYRKEFGVVKSKVRVCVPRIASRAIVPSDSLSRDAA